MTRELNAAQSFSENQVLMVSIVFTNSCIKEELSQLNLLASQKHKGNLIYQKEKLYLLMRNLCQTFLLSQMLLLLVKTSKPYRRKVSLSIYKLTNYSKAIDHP